MAQRTVKLYGKVWGDPAAPASITVSFDGQQRYQGSVVTSAGVLDTTCAFDDMIVMATWEIGLDVTGPNEFSFSVSGGDAIFHTMHGNYAGNVTQAGNIITPTDQNFSDLCGPSTLESDGHNNVEIDGVLKIRNATEEQMGKWIWPVLDGQTLTCQVQTVPAIL
jgi:hypothetical protein